jgi:Heterokaryon incompatibility protein (HET)
MKLKIQLQFFVSPLRELRQLRQVTTAKQSKHILTSRAGLSEILLKIHRNTTMRLINTEEYQIHDFFDTLSIPRYAILSHCWAADEVCFRDLRDPSLASEKLGLQKVKEFCLRAGYLGFQWLWIDTACVDRSSSAELSEAINSMFSWFRQSQACIVYLGDVEYVEDIEEQEKKIRQSQWMRRSWTLQELIAPQDVRFYAANWMQIGTKESLLPLLSEVTQVDKAVLEDAEHLSNFSIGRIMSWAANCVVSRVEDTAYSLLGLFGVNMPIYYGEGQKAFTRLQEKIFKRSDDASLFAWQSPTSSHQYRGLFSISPHEFAHFATQPKTTPLRINGDVYFSHGGVTIESDFGVIGGAEQDLVLMLSGGKPSEDRPYIGIVFHDCDGRFVRSAAQLILSHLDLPKRARKIRILHEVDLRTSSGFAKDLARLRTYRHSSERPRRGSTSRQTSSLDYFIPPFSSKRSQTTASQSSALSYTYATHETKSGDNENAWSIAESNLTDIRVFGREPGLAFDQRQDNTNFSMQKHRAKSEDKFNNRTSLSNRDHERPQPPISYAFERSDSDSPSEDMELFDSLPPDIPRLNPEHAFAAVKDELASSALAEFSSTILQATKQTGKRGKGAGFVTAHKRLKFTSDSHAAVEQVTDSENEDTVVVHHRRPLTEPGFSCPYYAHNPQGHQSCLTRADLQDVRDVKQHLWIVHRRSPFCPICREIFQTTADCDQHIKARSCVMRTEPDIEGITTEQMRLLARRPDPELSQEESWFAVWDVVFSGAPRPSQARLSGLVESGVCRLRDYWARRGGLVISKFLEARGLTNYDVEDEERSLEALYVAVLEQMIDEMVAELREPRGAEV